MIYIYQDSGVSKTSLTHTLYTLNALLGSTYTIRTINAAAIKAGAWMDNAALLVMPGGADLPYVRKLTGLGNQLIKTYVQQGGAYLGICAGAYYASKWIEFDRQGPLAVSGSRELAFFAGQAIGPALASYDPQSYSGARVIPIQITLDQQAAQKIDLLFNGGPYFSPIAPDAKLTVIGWYPCIAGQVQPAILHIRYGQGSVILSAIHCEYAPELLDSHDQHLAMLLPALVASSQARQALIQQLFCLLKLKLGSTKTVMMASSDPEFSIFSVDSGQM